MFILLFHFDSEGCAVGELDVVEGSLEVFAFVAAEVAAFVVERHKRHVILAVLAAHDAEGSVLLHFLPAFLDVAEGTVGGFGFDAIYLIVPVPYRVFDVNPLICRFIKNLYLLAVYVCLHDSDALFCFFFCHNLLSFF